MKSIIEEKLKPKAIKQLPESYVPAGNLHVPDEVKARFESEGYVLRWIRIYLGNAELDVKNIRRKEAEGYSFVTKSEVPEMATSLSSYFKAEIDRHGDLITVGDVALAKLPMAIREKRKEYYENLTRNRSRSIVSDLRKHSIGDPARGDVITVERPNSKVNRRDVDFGD